MRNFTYLDKEGKTLFFETEQKDRINFVGIFEVSDKEKNYMVYDGNRWVLRKDNLLFEIYIRTDLEEYKKMLSESILEKYNQSISKLKSSYPVEEVTGWDIKSLQSKAWIEANDKQALIDSNSVAMLANESDGTIDGITNLAQRVLNNSVLYQTIYGKNTRKHKEYLAQINAASDLQQLAVIEGIIKYD